MQDRARVGCASCLSSDMWKHRGCPLREHEKKSVKRVQPLIVETGRCPVHGAGVAQGAYAEILVAIDNGFLPYEGGTLDQPYAFVELVNHVKAQRSAAESEKMKRARKK